MTFESNQNREVCSQEALLRAGARRRLAGVFFRDAQRPENSLRTRADLAFEAVYLCALAATGLAAEEFDHPSPEVLKSATEFLGLTTEPVSYTHLRAHETDSYLV